MGPLTENRPKLSARNYPDGIGNILDRAQLDAAIEVSIVAATKGRDSLSPKVLSRFASPLARHAHILSAAGKASGYLANQTR